MGKLMLYCITTILFAFTHFSAGCQYYFYNEEYYDAALTWQLGFSGGGMNCLTDLGGRQGKSRKFINDINWNATRACGSFFIGPNYQGIVGARLELSFGGVKASDQVLRQDQSAAYGRYIRNLGFRSNIRELTFSLEFYPFSIIRPYENPATFHPYVVAGIGSFNFCPETYYKNSWINLSELHTEGQGFAEYPDRKPYKLTQVNMPLGMGLKFEASPVLNIHFEIIYRKLWTDYLDDVSKTYIQPSLFKKYFAAPYANLAAKLADRRLTTDPSFGREAGDIRGNDENKDAYFSCMVKIAFVLGRQKRG